MRPGSYSETTNRYPARFAGSEPYITQEVTIAQGQVLEAGSVLGRLTVGGQHVLSHATTVGGDAIADGSQIPDVVLTDDVDATAAAKKAVAYVKAHLVQEFLKFGRGHTAASTREVLRDKGIFVGKSSLPL